jgi:phosphohistidine phosphatase
VTRGARTLYVLRHAKSSWDEPVADHDRGLAPRGRRALRRVARYLEDSGTRPERVLCSSARRALDTLDPLLASIGGPEVSVEEDLYGASAPQLADRLRRVEASIASVMVVGHNPGLQDLILALAEASDHVEAVRAKFPTAALATLEFDAQWADLAPGCARLVSLVRPKDLDR